MMSALLDAGGNYVFSSINRRHVYWGFQPSKRSTGWVTSSERKGWVSYSCPPRHSTFGCTNCASSLPLLPEVVISDEAIRCVAQPVKLQVSDRRQALAKSRTSMNAPYSQ